MTKVSKTYFGLSRVSSTLPAPEPGAVRLAERCGRRDVQGICRQVGQSHSSTSRRRLVSSLLVAVPASGRRPHRRTRRCRGTAVRRARRPAGRQRPVQAAELGVDGDRDPDLPAEGGAEGVLEPGAQPALELVAGEVVGDRDDRGALVQGHRPARGQPGPLVGRQVLDQRAPDRGRARRARSWPVGGTGSRALSLQSSSMGVPTPLHGRARRRRCHGHGDVLAPSGRVAARTSRVRRPRWSAGCWSTRLSTGCACCPDRVVEPVRGRCGGTPRRPGKSPGQRRFLGGWRRPSRHARGAGGRRPWGISGRAHANKRRACGSSGCPQAARFDRSNGRPRTVGRSNRRRPVPRSTPRASATRTVARSTGVDWCRVSTRMAPADGRCQPTLRVRPPDLVTTTSESTS